MKHSGSKALSTTSREVIIAEGCHVERDSNGNSLARASAFENNKHEEVVINQYHFDTDTADEQQLKKIKALQYVVLPLFSIVVVLLGAYTLWPVHNQSKPITVTQLENTNNKPKRNNLDNNIIVRDSIENDALIMSQLEEIASDIIQDKKWNNARLSSFISQLNSLDSASRTALSHLPWYQHFAFLLQTELLEKTKINAGDNVEEDYPQELLLALTIAMNIEYVDGNIAVMASQDPALEQLLVETQDSLANYESSVQQTSYNGVDGKIPSGVVYAKWDSAATSSKLFDSPHVEEAPKIEDSDVQFSENQITPVLDRYIKAYQKGQTDKILQLHLFDGVSKIASIGELRESLDTLFNKSSKRNINFNNVEWEFFKNKAFGNGEYHADIVYKKDKTTQTIKAHTNITMQFVQNNWHIVELSIIAPEVKVVKAKKTTGKKSKIVKSNKSGSTKNKKKTARTYKSKAKTPGSSKTKSVNAKSSHSSPVQAKATPKTKPIVVASNSRKQSLTLPAVAESPPRQPVSWPTAAELERMVAQLVKAYDAGDLDGLALLFSQDARTNDQNSLKDIKREYRELFTKTSDRQMFINGLSWSYDKRLAKGVGKLNVMVITDDNQEPQKINGTIRIIAEKFNNEVLITHLYHKVNM